MLNENLINWNETENTPSQTGIFRTPPYGVFRIPMTAFISGWFCLNREVGADIQPETDANLGKDRQSLRIPYGLRPSNRPRGVQGCAHGR